MFNSRTAAPSAKRTVAVVEAALRGKTNGPATNISRHMQSKAWKLSTSSRVLQPRFNALSPKLWTTPAVPATLRPISSSAVQRLATETSPPKQRSKVKGKSAHVDGTRVVVEWADGGKSGFDNIWLRDHCHCADCFHKETRQRLVNTLEIPADLRASKVRVLHESDSLEVIWDTADKHKTVFELSWLRHHSYDPRLKADTELTTIVGKKVLWDAAGLQKQIPIVEYGEVMQSSEGLAKWLKNIEIYGVGFVDNVPVSKEDTERLARRICFVRESHYGGFWDFTANLAHADTAYTTLPLRAHTDTTYFTDPVGLQMFHLLEFNGKGGESLFVDGFHIADQLRKTAPEAYEALATIPVATHSAGDPETLVVPTPRARPILNVDPFTRHVFQVRYNNDDRSPLSPAISPDLTADQVRDFYAALRKWSAILQEKKNEFWIQLTPGRVAIFDNWRVLHGRASFSGHRRLIGCYLNWDDYRSRVRTVAGQGGVGGLERWQL